MEKPVNITRKVIQSVLATTIIFILLLFIQTVSNLTVIASLGASAFITFTVPHKKAAEPRYLIGGYMVGIVCGVLMHYANFTGAGMPTPVIACALAFGLAMFLMIVLRVEHPPAAALALGLVVEDRVLLTAFLALACVGFISLLKTALKRWLIDLT